MMDIKAYKNKKAPILYKHKKECCGCTACVSACPVSQNTNHKALIMCSDECGFLYPKISSEYCIRCYKCISVCPMK